MSQNTTTNTNTSVKNINPLVTAYTAQEHLPSNPHSRPPSSTTPDPAHLTPGQVVWNSVKARLSTLLSNRIPPPITTPDENLQEDTAADESPPTTNLRQAQEKWATILKPPISQKVQGGNRPIVLSVENQKSNTEWGDPIEQKSATTTRIYGLNVNGLSLDRRGGQFDVLCGIMKEVQADVVCGQEHNLDSDQTPVRSIIFHTIRNHWQRSKATFGTTPIAFNNMYKPGGTFMVTAGNLSGRLHKEEKDPWGRWVSHTYHGKDKTKLTIISAYQVCDKEISPGTTTTAAQQHSLLIKKNDKVQNPRTAFRRDLTSAIQGFQAKHHEILLLGDFNEPFGSDPEGMTKLAVTCDLIDLMSVRHSTPPPATYARGRKRLDYALGTTHVSNSMLKCGYEAFNTRFHSDHRAYYLDFDTTLLFGTDTQALSSQQPRVLKSNNVNQTTQYIKLKYDFLNAHGAFETGHKLSKPGNRHRVAERLDRIVVQSSLAAESQLKTYDTPAWSMKLVRARNLVLHLSKCASMARTGLDHLHQLPSATATDLQDWNTEPFEIPTTLQECVDKLCEAKRDVKRIVKDSYAHRDAEQRQRIRDLEASISPTNKKSAKRLRRLQKAEAIKELFRKLKPLRDPDGRKGVTRIEIPSHPETDPKSCTEWQQIEVPTDVLYHLHKRNRKHFSQAQGSPFTVSPLVDQLGYCGDGPSADQILDGTYDAQGMDSNVALLLRHLKQTAEMAALPSHPTVTEQDYRGKLQVWKESTTTSPSGLHLGHYKALIARHKYTDLESDDEEENAKRDEWNHMQSNLLTLHVQMLNYALERGYAYERWHSINNTIIFKDPDNVRIHRTRVIHIYEADYNLMLGIKWRVALYQAEALRELNQGQYGSRPRRNAIDPVFIEEMQFEIARASRKTLVQTNYDATSCYDRIIINLAMLVSRKYGVPFLIALTNARTLEQAIYRIRTELGVSNDSYSHSSEHPIHGTGQGSGNSPAIWCFLSSVLFDCYDELAYKATYCNPDRTNFLEIGMIGFVDDSNGQVNCFTMDESSETVPASIHKLRTNVQAWANVLGASGGALEIPKCCIHLNVYDFSAKGDPVLVYTKPPVDEPVTAIDPITQKVQALQILSPYTAHKTLGHYKEPAGTQSGQYKKLWEKSDDITNFLWKCTLEPSGAWTFYYACYLPSVGYPLSCSSLTYAQCDRIQRKAMQIIVPKCGYNRHTKREIIYGPMLYGGASFRHLYMEQGVAQVTTFLRHWRQQLTPGKLLKSVLAWHQLSLGISYPLLSRVHESLPHFESKWLASMRIFLAEINATIEVDEPGIPPKQRERDEYLMDMILESGQFTNLEIRRLNYCRLFLQAVTLSDITDTSGEQLDLSKRQGELSMYSSRTMLLNVKQDRPSPVEWKLWRKANLIWSHPDGTLHTPLGEWLHRIHQQRQCHLTYTRKHRMSHRMYIHMGDQLYMTCHPVPDQPQVFKYGDVVIPFASIPPDSQPAEVAPVEGLEDDNWRVFTDQRPPIPPTRQHPITETFEDFVQTLEQWETDLLRHTTMDVDPYTLCDALTTGFKSGTDGSVRYHTQGSFGWMLSTNHGERVAKGMGPARGPKPTSYRAEACGMLSFLRFLLRVAEYTTMVEPWKGKIVSDSESVLKTLSGGDVDPDESPEAPLKIDGDKVVLNVLCPDWDILIEIQHAMQQLPGITIQYIKAHQDDKIPYPRLPLLAQLNCDADKQAGEFQDQHGCVRPLLLMTPRTGALIHLNGSGSITGNFATTLRTAYSGPRLLQHLRTKNNWSEATCESINWDAHSSCLGKHINTNSHYTKLVQDILPTHSWLNKMDKGSRTCPCCDEINENRDHILRCPAVSRNQWRHALLEEVSTFCSSECTFPPLQSLLLDVLRQWLYCDTTTIYEPTVDNYPQHLHKLINLQTRIGWSQMFNGRFCTEWSEIQDAYYYRERATLPVKKKSGLTWQTGLINKIWDKWYDLWKMRNEDVHGKDMASKALAEKREVKRQLEEIYEMKNHIEPSAQALLCADIRTHLEQPTWAIQNWLAMYGGSYFAASAKRVKKLAIRGVPSIRNYFNQA